MASKLVRAPIPTSKRAKIFQPIDALVDLREAIAVKEQITEAKRELTEDSIAEINKTLLKLQKGQVITVVYYGIYEHNHLQLSGPVSKIDPYWCSLQIDSTVLSFQDIHHIDTDTYAESLPPMNSESTRQSE